MANKYQCARCDGTGEEPEASPMLARVGRFPRAKVKATGWTIDPNLLIEIDNEVTAAGWETCMEIVEVIMLSAERRLVDGTNSTDEQS